MNRMQAEERVIGLLKPLFAFAQRRCSSLEDAEDLTQEIVLRLLRTLPKVEGLQHVESYCWTVAHHTLANYYRHKARNGYGDLPDEVADGFDLTAGVERQEAERRLQLEIAHLSEMQRQVVILFYYDQMKQQAIAETLQLSLAMVKWHLSQAKIDLKRSMKTMRANSELKFNPIRFERIGCNGSTGTMGHNANFLRSSLAQNIIYAVRHKALTINQIADALGVSPVYVESDAEFLAKNGFLLKTTGGYISNCLIDEPTNDMTNKLNELYIKAAERIAPDLFDLLSQQVKIGEDGISCPDGDMNFALWSLVPYVIAICNDEADPQAISFEEAATLRPDGGQNICSCSVATPGVSKAMYEDDLLNMSGPSWNGGDSFLLWLIDTEWSHRRIGDYGPTIGRDYSLLQRYLQKDTLSRDELAHLISRGYLKREQSAKSESNRLQIVRIQGKAAKERLLGYGNAVMDKHRAELERWKAPYLKAVMEATPAHLHKAQSYGLQHILHNDAFFILHCLKNLVNAGKLRLPTDKQRMSLTAVAVTTD